MCCNKNRIKIALVQMYGKIAYGHIFYFFK